VNKEKKDSKRWILLALLVLILLLLLAFCSRDRNESTLVEPTRAGEPLVAVTGPTEQFAAAGSPMTAVVEPTTEPTALPPLGEITIISPLTGERIPAYDFMGHQTGIVSWFLGPGGNSSQRQQWEPHLLIWEEYPGADEYMLQSRIPGENGEFLGGYTNYATSENCQSGRCTQTLGLCGPSCNENNTIIVLAFQGGSTYGVLIGIGQVTVTTYWDNAMVQYCSDMRCTDPCPTKPDPSIEEWMRLRSRWEVYH
jgi:hypothetical protein